MIKGILFALFIILLIAFIGLAIFFGVKTYNDESQDYETASDKKRHIEQKYKDKIDEYRWRHTAEEVKEYAKSLQPQMDAELDAVVGDPKPKTHKGSFIGMCVAAVAMLGLTIAIPGSFHQVEAGTYAVVKHLGKIEEVRTPGTYFDFYMTKSYEIYDATVQQIKINTAAYSKDGQTMDLEVYLQYQIQLDKLVVRDENGKIIQTEGIAGKYVTLQSLQDRIETQCIEKTKAVMSSAEAMTIIQDRAKYSEDVSTTVRNAIGPDYYVNVQDVVLTNIDFTDEFEKAVEDKVTAEQQKQAAITKAEAELEVAKIEAEKKIAEAEGDAQAQLIAAEAAAKAATAKFVELARAYGYTITETTDEAGIKTYVIDVESGPGKEFFETVVKEYLEYLAYLEQWNGELPDVVSGDNGLSIIVPGGGNN